MLPVAVQFYSVRDEAEKDFFGTLKKIKEMGYEGVEFAGLFGNNPEKIRDFCNEIDLVPVSAHVPLDDMIDDAKGTLEAYKTIGCKYVAVPYITEERRPGAEKWDETVSAIKEIGAVAKDMGLTLLYHNHDFEFVKIDGEYGLDVLYNSVPADLLQTELDTCWVNVGGEVPADYILKYTGRAPVVHLKDFVMKGKDKHMKLYDLIGIDDEAESADEEDFSFKPVGYGVQDFPAILAAAEKAGAEWVVVEQDQPDKGNTPLNAVKMSIEYLNNLGKKGEKPMEQKTCKIGCIGMGGRGRGMMEMLMSVPGVIVPAVCDLVEERIDQGIETVKKNNNGEYEVHGYSDYKTMFEMEDLDAVYVATTWITHISIAIDAMKAGLHVGLEVGGASSVNECFRLVRTSEETGKFCMLMENCCYDRKEMAALNMTKMGVFGEIIHCEGGYRHDLRDEIVLGRENIHGRLVNFMHRNGELYPTHEIGPIAKILDINRGNRFVSLVSMSSKSKGLNEWIKNNKGTDYDLYGYDWSCGDITTTIIKCANGETITINHDCCLPRPYSREFMVQGTKGLMKEVESAEGDDAVIYLEGISEKPHNWEYFNEKHRAKYEHPLWRDDDTVNFVGGHGGMDYLILAAFAESVQLDAKPPIDVYDTATWMVITALSEQSVAMGGSVVTFPDFTDGKWIEREPYRRGRYCLDEVCTDYFEGEDK